MKPISLTDCIAAVNGVSACGYKDISIENVSTDTRTIKKGDLFIPLCGKNFDGHDYIEEAFGKGAVCVFSEKEILGETVIRVPDTLKALGDLAMYYRSLFDITVVAVTGSTGKTTTKDLIASVLSEKFNVLHTEGNLNNEIGLPQTIFNIDDSTDVAVLEMGMSNFGEIHNLSRIARPDIAVITNIGVSHIENLGSREGILKAKCEIFDYLPDTGVRILNGDDDMLIGLRGKFKRTYFYGIESSDFEVYADSIVYNGLSGINCHIHTPQLFINADIPLPGKHMVSNSLAAAAAGSLLGLSQDEIKLGLMRFKPTKMRMDIAKIEKYTLINDVYNANPVSVKASIDVLSLDKSRRVAILGDMFELGENSPDYHYKVGQYAAEQGIDVLVCIGCMSINTYDGAKSIASPHQKVYYFETQEAFFDVLDNILLKDDTILVKASRGMRFEKTIEKLMIME